MIIHPSSLSSVSIPCLITMLFHPTHIRHIACWTRHESPRLSVEIREMIFRPRECSLILNLLIANALDVFDIGVRRDFKNLVVILSPTPQPSRKIFGSVLNCLRLLDEAAKLLATDIRKIFAIIEMNAEMRDERLALQCPSMPVRPGDIADDF